MLQAAHGEQHREVAVGGDDHAAVGPSGVEDRLVGGGEQAEVRDVGCLVARCSEDRFQARREVRVEQELHAGRDNGTSCSLTTAAANSSAARTSACSRYG